MLVRESVRPFASKCCVAIDEAPRFGGAGRPVFSKARPQTCGLDFRSGQALAKQFKTREKPMNGHARSTELKQARNSGVFKLTATAHAIRSALAVSATVLALSGSGVAIAGTCGDNGANIVSCDGTFDTPVSDKPLVFGVHDLTVILGVNSPSSVNSTDVDGIQLTGTTGSETLYNYSSIDTYGGADANAVDITANSNITIANAGSMLANVYTYGGNAEDVTAVTVYSSVGDITIYNQVGSSITAIANYGNAVAVDAVTGQGSISVTNAGDIQASSRGTAAIGVSADANSYGNIYPAYGEVAIANKGSISASVDAISGRVFAWGTYSAGHDVSVVNDGDISATANVVLGNATAVGVQNNADMFSTLVNGVGGNISAVTTTTQGVYLGPDASAFGAIVVGSLAGVNNYGTISAEATSHSLEGVIVATGVQIYSPSGIATIVNSGDISAVATSTLTDPVGYANFANVFAYGTSTAPLFTYYSGASTTINSGDISAIAHDFVGAAYSYGAITRGSNSAMYNNEGGAISATSEVDSRGRANSVAVLTVGFDYAHDVNYGTITAYSVAHAIINDGRFSYGAANATGVRETTGYYGIAELVNRGDIDATAVVLDSEGRYGGGANATGVYQYGWLYAELNNQGDISASAGVNLGVASAIGVNQQSRYYGSYVGNQEGASISASAHSGSTSNDYSGGFADAYAVRLSDAGEAIVYNYGQLSAIAVVDPNDREYFSNPAAAIAVGIYEFATYVALVSNHGDIGTSASADFGYATAFGSKIMGFYGASTDNSGAITAVAHADNGNALATASYALSPGQKFRTGCSGYNEYGYCTGYTYGYAGGIAKLDNQGDLLAQSSANAGVAYAYGATVAGRLTAKTSNDGTIVAIANAEHGTADAFGSITDAGYGAATMDNTGSIRAQASADHATATGAMLIGSYGDVDTGYYATSASNSGSITALATGAYTSTATGLKVLSRYNDGASVLNDEGGKIIAAAYGPDANATAVYLYSHGVNALTNNGDIAALGDGTRVAITSNATAQASIFNNGTLTGSIQTGNYNDVLDNAGVWNAIQQTDLGAGDDSIDNAVGGTIRMHDASINFGAYSESGNSFDNRGTITVSGSDNVIDMGSNPTTLLPAYAAQNPNAFNNAGVIDFRDGAADDVLTIAGDFSGNGELNVDVSGLQGSSDMLHIYGDVIPGTHDTVNLNFLGMPTTASSEIAIVTVSGNSAPGSFALGTVNNPNASFLNLGFSLHSHLDAGNATDDVFSLAVDVTGLSDPGVLAASVVPGVQSLMNSQVGTWRQRIGAIDKSDKGGASLWARLFQDKGTINPDHAAANFGQGGNFGFDQNNSGSEVGADVGINDEFSIGVLAAKSDASQHLSGPRAGSSKITADTYGIYGTWISPSGFYLDGSYRWTSFTTKMSSAAGGVQVDGDAGTFNVEASYAWTLEGGLKIEPQFQYTHTNVSNVDQATVGLTRFQAQNGTAERGRLGVMLRKSYGDADKGTLWTPYASINAVHEFDGQNDYTINDDFFGRTSSKGTSGLLELGVSAQTGNLSVFGGLSWQDGGALSSFVGGQLGVRYTFGHGASSR
jgi:outer membrane autotransporter protein